MKCDICCTLLGTAEFTHSLHRFNIDDNLLCMKCRLKSNTSILINNTVMIYWVYRIYRINKNDHHIKCRPSNYNLIIFSVRDENNEI